VQFKTGFQNEYTDISVQAHRQDLVVCSCSSHEKCLKTISRFILNSSVGLTDFYKNGFLPLAGFAHL
jgi:hypothetical protein